MQNKKVILLVFSVHRAVVGCQFLCGAHCMCCGARWMNWHFSSFSIRRCYKTQHRLPQHEYAMENAETLSTKHDDYGTSISVLITVIGWMKLSFCLVSWRDGPDLATPMSARNVAHVTHRKSQAKDSYLIANWLTVAIMIPFDRHWQFTVEVINCVTNWSRIQLRLRSIHPQIRILVGEK